MTDVKGYWLTRLLLERGLAVTCLIAFLAAFNQFKPLLGEHGLLPVKQFVRDVPFRESPSLFYLLPTDRAFQLASIAGIILSLLLLSGLLDRLPIWVTPITWAAVYVLYLSFVNVGQTFYGFGWESILLEGCFFAIFLGSMRSAPQDLPIWFFRWLLFRIMFGAGLIKIRGDTCWRDLTCLNYYYETQPMPNALSWFFHWQPEWFHKFGVLFNHFAELIVPFAYFAPQPICGIAGVITILFQGSILISGNLSWLNFLTIVLAFSTIDTRILPGFLHPAQHTFPPSPPVFQWLAYGAGAITALMSIPVILNMISAGQVMNNNYNPFHLVGTYGAFGSITRPRYEVVVEATSDLVTTPATRWKEYEFKGKPTALEKRPPQWAPYHLRLDWLMWFAAFSDYRQHPWFVHLLAKLLEGDRDTLSLMDRNPFPEHPPQQIRALLYQYSFTTPDEHRRTGRWWKREFTTSYFPTVSLKDPAFQTVLKARAGLIERRLECFEPRNALFGSRMRRK